MSSVTNPGETHAASELWLIPRWVYVWKNEGEYFTAPAGRATPCCRSSPAAQNSNCQRACSRRLRFRGGQPRCLLRAFSPLPVSTSAGAAVPNQVAAAQLRFLPFPPSLPRPAWRQPLGRFSARGLNLLSPSWEHSVTAAIAGWPGCHRSWCPFYYQIRGHCRDAYEAFQIRRCTSSSRFQIQQRGFCIQPTGSEFISPMQTALHCLPVN